MKLRIVAQGFRPPREGGECFDICEISKSNHEREIEKSEAMSKTPKFCIRPRPFDKGHRVLFSTSVSRGWGRLRNFFALVFCRRERLKSLAGWAARTRTSNSHSQSVVTYHLSTAQQHVSPPEIWHPRGTRETYNIVVSSPETLAPIGFSAFHLLDGSRNQNLHTAFSQVAEILPKLSTPRTFYRHPIPGNARRCPALPCIEWHPTGTQGTPK
jgi:hypothetical protein